MVSSLMQIVRISFLNAVLAEAADTATRNPTREAKDTFSPSADPIGVVVPETEFREYLTGAKFASDEPRSSSSPNRESTADSGIGNFLSEDALMRFQGEVPLVDGLIHEDPLSPQRENDPKEDMKVDADGRKFLRALEPMDHSFDFDAFFTSDDNHGAKTACQEDVKMCPHALTTMHCLSNHLYELTESCMHAVEGNFPSFCAIEIDRHKCNGLDMPVVLCLANYIDNLSDECGHVQAICQHLMVTRKAKQLPMPNGNAEHVQLFRGCPMELVKLVDSNRCCSYDTVALETHCQLPTLHECVRQRCEIEGQGLMSAYVVEGPGPRRKAWSYHCCPYGAVNHLAELVLGKSWQLRTQMLLLLSGIACLLIIVFVIGPQLDSFLLRREPWCLNHKGAAAGYHYGTVPMEVRNRTYGEEVPARSVPW